MTNPKIMLGDAYIIDVYVDDSNENYFRIENDKIISNIKLSQEIDKQYKDRFVAAFEKTFVVKALVQKYGFNEACYLLHSIDGAKYY